MRPVICRTLRREYRLHAPDERISELLQFAAAVPQIVRAELQPVDVPIERRDGFLSAVVSDGEVVEGSPAHLVGAMHRIVLADVVAHHPGAPIIHGATVIVDGRRLLLVGHKGSGKSTLALHLAASGHDVEGDEHLLLLEDGVVARPRTLRIKEGSLRLVERVPDAVWQAPSLTNWDGAVIRAVSPVLFGRPWVIQRGTLDGIVFLMANHGGRSTARRIRPEDVFGRLMGNVMLPTTGIAAAAGRLRQIATTTPAHQLLLGDLKAAEWHLRHVAAGLTTP